MGDKPNWFKKALRSSKEFFKHGFDSGGKARYLSSAREKRTKIYKPQKLNTNNSGFFTQKGGFVTKRYLDQLEQKKLDKNGNEVAWAKRLYDKVEGRTHIKYSVDQDNNYHHLYTIPDYGKPESVIYTNETNMSDRETDFILYYNKDLIFQGSGFASERYFKSNAKVGDNIYIFCLKLFNHDSY